MCVCVTHTCHVPYTTESATAGGPRQATRRRRRRACRGKSDKTSPSMLLLLQVAATAARWNNSLVVTTEGGDVRGARHGECHVWFGIPYAAPPTGQLRWAPPQRASPWGKVARDCTTDSKPICWQGLSSLGLVEEARDTSNLSEDCLFINVQSPANASGPIPVMLYIHGGSNLIGSGSGLFAQRLCAEGVMVVSFNYRLGALGGLALPALLSEGGTAGNYGLQDQRAAMAWVQRNIRSFGGDPRRVTIAGESSGAMAVMAHLALPRSAPLFQQAIAMSGNDDSLPLDEAFAAGDHFATAVGCTNITANRSLECLRGRAASDLVALQDAVFNGSMRALQWPTVDGYELPLGSSLRAQYDQGRAQPKPLLAGTNKDDISIFFGDTYGA
eukprot:2241897-Prymnesium_polylepis.1